MKRLKKMLSVALSLVLCGSLVAPSFAAVEFNKDQHVDADTGALKEGGDYYLSGDVTLDKTLVIGAGISASIELNGHTLQLNDQHSATVDSNGYLSSVFVEDSSKADEKPGTTDRKKSGNVIKVTGEGADLTVTDSSALDEEGNYVVGQGAGAISGGYNGGSNHGAGVRVENGGSFTMKGGEISENISTSFGGGVYVEKGTVDLDGVSVVKNNGGNNGGGIYAGGGSTVTMKNTDISSNTVQNGGGGVYAGNYVSNPKRGETVSASTVTMEDSTVSKNTVMSTTGSTSGGGIYVNSGSTVNLTDTDIIGNKMNASYGKGAGIAAFGNASTVTINGGSIAQNIAGHSTVSGNISIFISGAQVTENDVTFCGNVTPTFNKKPGITENKVIHGSAAWDITETPATCKAEGLMTYTCKYCSETKTETIPMLAHTPGEAVRENVVDATCAEEGSYNSVVYCSECGEKLGSEAKTIEKLEHTPGEAARENEVPAQIGVAGSYEEVIKCSECGEEISRDKKEIPALAQPVTPDTPVVTPDEPEDPTVEIDEPDVPLAGLPIELEPEDMLTRGQLVKILYWMDSEPAAELATFLDVLADSDYAEAIGWAQASGIALGVGGNRFAPDDYVTRGQLIDFLNRYAKYVGSELVLELDGEANEVLTWAVAEEIINDFFARL